MPVSPATGYSTPQGYGQPPTTQPQASYGSIPGYPNGYGDLAGRRRRKSILLGLGLIGLLVLVSAGALIVSTAGGGHASTSAEPTGVPGHVYAGTFSPTGSMTSFRVNHTATLLSDGRVLIAGGKNETDEAHEILTTAELYDPKTGTFSQTGQMAKARALATATRLADGRVLVAGGNDAADNILASAELYDPKTGVFSPTGSMTSFRVNHTATLLSDGRVLMAGGQDDTDHTLQPLNSAELYDPRTGTFSPTGSMTSVREGHTATLLADGHVLVAGGENGSANINTMFLSSAELYDPKIGTFSPTGSMSSTQFDATATLLADGRVLIIGNKSAELYS